MELVETGKQDSKETERLLLEYVKPMLNTGIDCLVLGCTHYPYLIPTLKKILPDTIQIIDSGYAVAKQTKAILVGKSILRTEQVTINHTLYTSKDIGLLKPFMGSSGRTEYLDF